MDKSNGANKVKYAEPVKVSEPAKVKKATESGFDIKTCMNNFQAPDTTFQEGNDSYFDSYSHFGIHEEMLKDRIRTIAYRNAIMKNSSLFKDKIVLDVGCGTGILSIFAAKSGAKHVYGIENASIADHAQNVIKQNGFGDKITIIRGKVEEVELPVEKVDIIISEWMGYFLLYESMLDTVLFARDKWLQPEGILLPDRAIMWLAGLEDGRYKSQTIDFWDNVYDVKMSSIKKWALFEPLVDVVRRYQINTNSCPILDIDIKTVKKEQLDFASKYQLQVRKNDKIHGLVAWFDVYFSHGSEVVRLSTSPFLTDTHWKQTIFYFGDNLTVDKEDTLSGSIAVKKSQSNPRELDIKLSYHINNQHHKLSKVQCYKIS